MEGVETILETCLRRGFNGWVLLGPKRDIELEIAGS